MFAKNSLDEYTRSLNHVTKKETVRRISPHSGGRKGARLHLTSGSTLDVFLEPRCGSDRYSWRVSQDGEAKLTQRDQNCAACMYTYLSGLLKETSAPDTTSVPAVFL